MHPARTRRLSGKGHSGRDFGGNEIQVDVVSDVRPHGTGPPMGWEWVTFGEEGNASPGRVCH